MEGAGGQGSGRRLKPAPNVVTLGLASNTPRRRPLNNWISTVMRLALEPGGSRGVAFCPFGRFWWVITPCRLRG